MACRHHDVQVFDGLRCCLACGETVFDTATDQESGQPRSQKAPYKYTHLNYSLGQEIRLCILFPGRPMDDVVVDLLHVNIRRQPPYEAISYAWATQDGDDSLSQTVFCRDGTISVTKTCEATLRRLRLPGRSRYLWVDAVCIDQNNVKERNHQVSFMGTIFSNASQVIIYLGSGNEATDSVLDYLNGDVNAFTNVKRGLSSIIADYLDHRWFDRVWILQEIALARLATMIAGKKTTRWTLETINKLLALCASLSIEPPSALRWLPASQPERDILSVLHKSRNCSSTDPRDKVFAVLGLAQAGFQDGFPIDYSLTVEEVFTQLATHLIYIEGGLRVLKYASNQYTVPLHVRNLPTWVPRWDVKAGCHSLPSQFDANELDRLALTWFTPTSPSHTASDVSDEPMRMFLKTLPKDQQPLLTATWLNLFNSWLLLSEESMPTIKSQMADPEVAALLLTKMHAPSFHFSISMCETDAYSREIDGESHSTNFAPSSTRLCLQVRAHELGSIKSVIGVRSVDRIHYFPNYLPKALDLCHTCPPCTKHFVATPICQHTPSVFHTISDEFIRDMKRVLGEGKTMFQMQQSIGAAHADVLAGDSIWVLDGADVPFILRKVDQHYVLIAECFVFRALRPSLCKCCGCELEPWPIVTQIIDLW